MTVIHKDLVERKNEFSYRIKILSTLQMNLSFFFYKPYNLYFLKVCKPIESSHCEDIKFVRHNDKQTKEYYNIYNNIRYNYLKIDTVFFSECLFPIKYEKTKTNVTDYYIDVSSRCVNTRNFILYKNLWNFNNTIYSNEINKNINYICDWFGSNEGKLYERIKSKIKMYMTIQFPQTCYYVFNIHNKPSLNMQNKNKYNSIKYIKVSKNLNHNEFILKYFGQETLDIMKDLKSKKVVTKRKPKILL